MITYNINIMKTNQIQKSIYNKNYFPSNLLIWFKLSTRVQSLVPRLIPLHEGRKCEKLSHEGALSRSKLWRGAHLKRI